MHKLIKKCMYVYKMVVITVEKHANTVVHTISVKNKTLFWAKMIDL